MNFMQSHKSSDELHNGEKAQGNADNKHEAGDQGPKPFKFFKHISLLSVRSENNFIK